MSHNVESMFSAGRPSWHGHNDLNVEEKVKWQEALTLSRTDWRVFKAPLYALVNESEFKQGADPVYAPVPTSDSWAIVRDNDLAPLGTVGSRFVPIQNDEEAKFASEIVDTGEANFITGGALGHGNIVWYCLELPKEILIGGMSSETTKLYLSVVNRHDGKGAFKAIVSPTKIECQNTMTMAFRTARSSFSIRHTANAELRMQQAREALQVSYAYADEFEKEMNALLNEAASKKTLVSTVEDIWGERPEDKGRSQSRWDNRVEEIEWVWANSPNIVDDVKNTRYGVLNAFTEWGQWGRNFRGTGGDPVKQDARRVQEVLMGSTARINQSAYEILAGV